MNISAKTIERLVDIITGNSEKSPYRSGPLLIEFFRDFGERDLYGQGFPSRASYVQVKLRKFNGMETMEKDCFRCIRFFRGRVQSRGRGGSVQSPASPGRIPAGDGVSVGLDGR